MKKILAISAIIFVIWGSYRIIFNFLNQPIESSEKPEIIDILQDPRQEMLKEPKLIYERPDGFRVSAIAEYKIQGIVLDKSVNKKFGGDSIYPIDVGIIWGAPAESYYNQYLKRWYTKSSVDTNKTLWVDFKKEPPNNWSRDYITNHISNNHINPANENIYNAIRFLNDGDRILMQGYLLRTGFGGVYLKDSSLSRTDSDCEDFYVEKIQIEDRVYN